MTVAQIGAGTVSADAPSLDISTVTTGRAMTHREVMDLPFLGNNITMLTRFSPGVQAPGTTQFLVQGQIGGGSEYTMPANVWRHYHRSPARLTCEFLTARVLTHQIR